MVLIVLMHIVTFSRLYPNECQPQNGLFVEQRLKHLIASGIISAKVVAPIPWFPFKRKCSRLYGKYASVKKLEMREGLEIYHPRFLHIPKITVFLTPLFMSISVLSQFKRIIENGYDFDVIDAHYFYPDGVAAVILGKLLNKPVVITARGTDINILPNNAVIRRQIVWAAKNSNALITVSKKLKDKLVALGVTREKITILKNGVDQELFYPVNKDYAFQKINRVKPYILSVGNLVDEKGHELAIRALMYIPNLEYLIVGDGPLKSKLIELSVKLGLQDRVVFIGAIKQEKLKYYYSAAEVFLFPSTREGMPNAVIESIACGTPVVATDVGGIPEIINDDSIGVLVNKRVPKLISAAVLKVINAKLDRNKIWQYAKTYKWDETTNGQINIFEQLKYTAHKTK